MWEWNEPRLRPLDRDKIKEIWLSHREALQQTERWPCSINGMKFGSAQLDSVMQGGSGDRLLFPKQQSPTGHSIESDHSQHDANQIGHSDSVLFPRSRPEPKLLDYGHICGGRYNFVNWYTLNGELRWRPGGWRVYRVDVVIASAPSSANSLLPRPLRRPLGRSAFICQSIGSALPIRSHSPHKVHVQWLITGVRSLAICYGQPWWASLIGDGALPETATGPALQLEPLLLDFLPPFPKCWTQGNSW